VEGIATPGRVWPIAPLGDGNMTLQDQPDGARRTDWWALFLIVLCYSFYNLDKSLISVLIEPIKTEFQLNDSQMGLLSGLAVSVPFAIACIPVGMLADRVNRRNLLAILVGGWSLVTGLTSLARSVPALFASRIGIGAFEAGFTPASLSQLSDRFPLRQRATVMGLFALGAPVGVFMGMAMGGYVEDTYGWRLAFLVAGVPGVILAALLWLTTNEPPRGGTGAEASLAGQAPPLASVLRFMMFDRASRDVALGMTWAASMLAVLAVWTPSLMRRSFDLSATDAGIAAGVVIGIGGAIGAATGGFLADRIGGENLGRKMSVPVVGAVLSALCGVIALLGGLPTGASIAFLGLTAFFGQFYIGTGYGVAATLAGPVRRAVVLSVLLVLFNLISYALGAGAVGKLSDLLAPRYGEESLRYAYAAALVFTLLSAVHFARARSDLQRREL
jgi:predicted MFS family arabinose efflux permease